MSSEDIQNLNAEKDIKSILQKDLSVKEIILVIGVFFIILIYGYAFIYPKYTEYKSLKSNLESINNEIISYESKIDSLPSLENTLENLNKELNTKSKVLDHNMEDGMFLIGLSKLMKNLEVDLITYSLDDPIEYNTFYAIPTTIEVKGNYKRIREIIEYLEEQKNVTQVLDYKMETYIDEENSNTETSYNSTETKVADSIVYWTNSGISYHKDGCAVLAIEKSNYNEEVQSGEHTHSNKDTACEVCKPYSTVSNNSVDDLQNEVKKASGDITARFKFIMYSSENPSIELKNDDYSTWKPGKYNPFMTTR